MQNQSLKRIKARRPPRQTQHDCPLRQNTRLTQQVMQTEYNSDHSSGATSHRRISTCNSGRTLRCVRPINNQSIQQTPTTSKARVKV
eukprot:5621486-Amphidinium_carterae.1